MKEPTTDAEHEAALEDAGYKFLDLGNGFAVRNIKRGGTPYRADTGSAFLLVKLCPDGKTINLRMESEAALREHVEAMWRYTNGYHLVAVVPLPNAPREAGAVAPSLNAVVRQGGDK